ncbi:hypothetical protein ABK040_001010 [Willaertia magna]
MVPSSNTTTSTFPIELISSPELLPLYQFLSIVENQSNLCPILPTPASFYKEISSLPSFFLKNEEEIFRKTFQKPLDTTSSFISCTSLPFTSVLNSNTPTTYRESQSISTLKQSNGFPNYIVLKDYKQYKLPEAGNNNFTNVGVGNIVHQAINNNQSNQTSKSGSSTPLSPTSLTINTDKILLADKAFSVPTPTTNYGNFPKATTTIEKINSQPTVCLDPEWKLYREVTTLNKQLEDILIKAYNDDCFSSEPQYNCLEELENHLSNEMSKRLDLVQVFIESEYYGEAYEQLNRIEQLSRKLDGYFSPKVELLHCKCLFLMGIILQRKKIKEESKEYLESAKERTDSLLITIAPSDFLLQKCNSFLVPSTRILHAEILLYLCEEMLRSSDMLELTKTPSKPIDLTISEKRNLFKILSSYLIPALHDIQTFHATNEPCVLNVDVFLLICYHIALCCRALNEMHLAKRYLSLSKQFINNNANTNTENDETDDATDDTSTLDNNNSNVDIGKLQKDIAIKIEKLWNDILKREEELKSDKKSKTTKKKWESDDDDDDDDWDIDLDKVPRSSLAGFLLGPKEDNPQQGNVKHTQQYSSWRDYPFDSIQSDIFPAKYRLFKSRTYRDEPMLPEMILTKFIKASQFEAKSDMLNWIQSLIPKKFKDQQLIETCSRDDYANFLLGRLEKRMNNNTDNFEFSVDLMETYYEICTKLMFIGKQPRMTQNIVVKFFESLNEQVTSNLQLHDRAFLFHICIDLLKNCINSGLFNLEEQGESEQCELLLSSLFNLFPDQRLSIIMAQCEIHIRYHLRQLKRGIFPDVNVIPSIYGTLLSVFNELFGITDDNILMNNDQFHELIDQKIKDETIFDVSNTLNFSSSPFQQYHSISNIATRIIVLLEAYDGLLRKHASSDNWLPTGVFHPLLSKDDRMRVLFRKFYSRLTISKDKADVAYILGSYWLGKEDEDLTKLAECVLFESVYLYHKSEPLVASLPLIMTHDGLKALKKFGEALYLNSKYDYASPIYECYIQNYRNLTCDYDYKFIDEFCALTLKNDDWNNSIKYYTILFEKACRDKRIAVIANTSSKLASLYMEKGELRNAERLKRDAIDIIKSFSKTYKNELDVEFTKLLLTGGNLERCIHVCSENINRNLEIQLCLVEAYLKKRWLKECERALMDISLFIENSVTLQQEVRIAELTVKYYIQKGLYGNALDLINFSLTKANRLTFANLAHLFKLKAKIFRAVASWDNPMQFPNELKTNEVQKINLSIFREGHSSPDTTSSTYLYSRRAEYTVPQVIFDAIECSLKAKEYYEACSNEIGIVKMDLIIAKIFIEYLFVPVALLGKNPEDFIYLLLQENLFQKQNINLQYIFERYIEPVLEIGVSSSDVFISMESYLIAAECRFLQGRLTSSKKFWCEMRDVFFTLFVDGNTNVVVTKGAPPPLVEKLYQLTKRLSRLLLKYDANFINSNIGIFDTYYVLLSEYELIVKRTHEPTSLSFLQQSSKVVRISSFGNGDEFNEVIEKNKLYDNYRSNNNSTLTIGGSKSAFFSSMIKSPASPFKSLPEISGINEDLQRNLATKLNEEDDYVAQLKDRVIERVYYCLLSMKFDGKKYTGTSEIESQLRFKNQQTMRRLYNLMNAIRECKFHKKKSFRSVSNEGKSMINKTIKDLSTKKLSLLPGDKLLIDSLMIAFTEKKESDVSSSIKNVMNIQYEGNSLRKQVSLTPNLTCLKRMNKVIRKHKLLEKLVLTLHLDNIVSFYNPTICTREFVTFGGRRAEFWIPDAFSNISTAEESGIVSLTKFLGTLSQGIGIASKTKSSSSQSALLQNLNIEIDNANYSELYDYVKGMITDRMREKKEKIFERSVAQMLKKTFGDLSIFKYKPDPLVHEKFRKCNLSNFTQTFNQKIGTFTKKKTMTAIPQLENIPTPPTPISLIVPSSLQSIPWELIFEENIIRFFSIRNIGTRFKKDFRNIIGKNNKKVPKFFCFYSSDESRNIQFGEDERRQWIVQKVQSTLNLKTVNDTPKEFDDSFSVPFHNPIVKYGKKPSSKSYRRKYEHVEFIKLSSVLCTPSIISDLIQSRMDSGNQYPVFLFNWCDLIDLTTTQMYISQNIPSSMMLFVPEGSYRKFIDFLMAMQECYGTQLSSSKESENGETNYLHRYLLLLLTILRTEREFSIPIAMFP